MGSNLKEEDYIVQYMNQQRCPKMKWMLREGHREKSELTSSIQAEAGQKFSNIKEQIWALDGDAGLDDSNTL